MPVDVVDVTAESWITKPAVGELTEVVELTPVSETVLLEDGVSDPTEVVQLTPDSATVLLDEGVSDPTEVVELTPESAAVLLDDGVTEPTDVVELTPDNAIETFGETELTDVVDVTPLNAVAKTEDFDAKGAAANAVKPNMVYPLRKLSQVQQRSTSSIRRHGQSKSTSSHSL